MLLHRLIHVRCGQQLVDVAGEASASSGADSLTDPLVKMALDVGLLDRQYRKLMDRQKQTRIVVGGM